MNQVANVEPNQFDRDATRIAFQRPPGNRVPDQDPDWYTLNQTGLRPSGGITWSEAVP